MKPFRILALDGGGVRGAFGAAFLGEIEHRLGRGIVGNFDLLAATSTGAITAASMAFGMSANDVVEFYRKHVPNIFHPRDPHEPRGWMKPVFPAARTIFRRRTGGRFDDFFRSRYCPHALRHSFEDAFGEATMQDLKSASLIVPAVNLSIGRSYVFARRIWRIISRIGM